MTDDPDPDEIGIHLTTTARSKCHRMISEYDLRRIARRALRGEEDRIQQRVDPGTGDPMNEYHVRTGKYSVVCKWDEHDDRDGDGLIVVTQSHAHANYGDRDSWRHVHEVSL